MKYCSNCGSKVEGSFCSNCGAKIESNIQVNNGNQLNNEVNNYFQQQIQKKKNHDGYRLASGIVMIILGVIVFFAGIYIKSELDGSTIYKAIQYREYFDMNLTLVFVLPGLLTLAGGILSIVSRKENILLLISGIAYCVAALCNICAISNISILAIVCLVFGPINIVFYTKTR